MRLPRGVKPRKLFLGRLLPAGALVALVTGTICGLASLEPWNVQHVTPLSVAGIALVAGAIGLVAAWFEEEEWKTQAALDRIFGTDEFCDPGSTWERWPRPPRSARPKLIDPPQGKEFWMKKLAERYARLARLEELRAPQTIIEYERRLIQKAIAELSPADALAVMRVWPQLAPGGKKKSPVSTPDKSN